MDIQVIYLDMQLNTEITLPRRNYNCFRLYLKPNRGPCEDGSHLHYTLSGRIGKVVASRAAVTRASPAEVALICTVDVALRVYCP